MLESRSSGPTCQRAKVMSRGHSAKGQDTHRRYEDSEPNLAPAVEDIAAPDCASSTLATGAPRLQEAAKPKKGDDANKRKQ